MRKQDAWKLAAAVTVGIGAMVGVLFMLARDSAKDRAMAEVTPPIAALGARVTIAEKDVAGVQKELSELKTTVDAKTSDLGRAIETSKTEVKGEVKLLRDETSEVNKNLQQLLRESAARPPGR